MKYCERSRRAAAARQQEGTVLAPSAVPAPGLQNESHQPALHTVPDGLQAITYYQNQPTAQHFPGAPGMLMLSQPFTVQYLITQQYILTRIILSHRLLLKFHIMVRWTSPSQDVVHL